MYFSRKQKTGTIITLFVLFAVLAFFVISLCLANAHGNTLVLEWQSWFGIAKQVVEEVPDIVEETPVVSTMLKSII